MALIGLKLLGFIIAVVGFALCVPGKQCFLLLSAAGVCLFLTLKLRENDFPTWNVS